MKPNTFLRKGLNMGDKVLLTVMEPRYVKNRKPKTVTVFFKGYRILCGASVSDGADTLVPVFVKPTKAGGMGRRHYGNAAGELMPWFENIRSVKVLKSSAA